MTFTIFVIATLVLLFVLWDVLVTRWQADLRRLSQSESDFRALTLWCRQLEDRVRDALDKLQSDLTEESDRRELASWQAWIEAGRRYRLEKIWSPVYPEQDL